MSSLFTQIWMFIKKWFARLGVLIIFVCLLLPTFGIPVNEKFLIGIITVLLLGIYEIAFDTKNAVGNLSQITTPTLYSLFQCRKDLELMLRKASRHETIVIDHLGLDMSQAWEYIHKLLFDENSKQVSVEYRLLILTDDKSKCSMWPKEVVYWSEQVPKSLERIQSDMEASLELFRNDRRRLKFSVKKYDEVPVMHGWSLRQPIKVWHVGHCRWRRKLFDWGPESYIKIDDLSRDSVTIESAKLFDSYFEHLWIVSSPVSNLQLDFDPKSKPGKKAV